MANNRDNKMQLVNSDDQKCGFPLINLLPNETIIKIFGYLKLNDRKSVSLVCRDWYDLVTTYSLAIEHKIVIKAKNTDFTTLMNSTRRFPCVDIQGSKVSEESILLFLDKFGFEINELYLKHSPILIIQQILNKCPSLKSLRCRKDDLFRANKLPLSLKTIYIRDNYFDTSDCEQLWNFLRSFGQVKHCIVHNLFWDFPNDHESYEGEDLKDFAARYPNDKVTLRASEIDIKSKKLTCNDFNEIAISGRSTSKKLEFSQFKNLSDIGFYGSESTCYGFHTKDRWPSVRNLTIWFDHICNECFDAMLHAFPSVANLQFFVDNASVSQLRKLCKIHSDLKDLWFCCNNISQNEDESEPFVLFKGLNKLKEISFNSIIRNDIKIAQMPELVSLHIDTFLDEFPEDKLKEIAEKCPNVEYVVLEMLDVDIEMLTEIVMIWPKLEELHINIYQSFVCFCEEPFINLLNILVDNCKHLKRIEYRVYRGDCYEASSATQEKPDWLNELIRKVAVKDFHIDLIQENPVEKRYCHKPDTENDSDEDNFDF